MTVLPATPRQPKTRYHVTGTTPAATRTVIGRGVAGQDQAASLALAWSRSARYGQTAVRIMPSGQVLAAYRDGEEIPVPLAERQPTPAELAAALAVLDQITSRVEVITATHAGLSAAQAGQLGSQLGRLEGAVRALRGVCTIAGNGHREDWYPGDQAWFEYRCLESDDSCDADLWYRSHQQVTVISTRQYGPASEGMPYAERCEEGIPSTYKIRFADGHVAEAWEDELLAAPCYFERPDPPEGTPTHSAAGRQG